MQTPSSRPVTGCPVRRCRRQCTDPADLVGDSVSPLPLFRFSLTSIPFFPPSRIAYSPTHEHPRLSSTHWIQDARTQRTNHEHNQHGQLLLMRLQASVAMQPPLKTNSATSTGVAETANATSKQASTPHQPPGEPNDHHHRHHPSLALSSIRIPSSPSISTTAQLLPFSFPSLTTPPSHPTATSLSTTTTSTAPAILQRDPPPHHPQPPLLRPATAAAARRPHRPARAAQAGSRVPYALPW